MFYLYLPDDDGKFSLFNRYNDVKGYDQLVDDIYWFSLFEDLVSFKAYMLEICISLLENEMYSDEKIRLEYVRGLN